MVEEVTVSAAARNDPELQRFTAQDFLKSSYFRFFFPQSPENLQFVNNNDDLKKIDFRNFSLFCESIEFPGKTISAADYKIPGFNKIRVAYSRDYNEFSTTFIHNIETPVYKFFIDWVDFITGQQTTADNLYYDEYAIDFQLQQFTDLSDLGGRAFGGLSSLLNSLDKLNTYTTQSSKAFKLTDIGQTFVNVANAVGYRQPERKKIYDVQVIRAYPILVNSMPSNWADDNFHRLVVTWAYEEFMVNDSSRTKDPWEVKLREAPQTPPTKEQKEDSADSNQALGIGTGGAAGLSER